jgi:Lrp/AsnC family transcriptional regulator, leucine-responsive regulatory protein
MDSQAPDLLDTRILRALTRNARSSWREIGDLVHLSATSVAERVRNMERQGVIRGYRTDIDPAALGRGLRALIDIGLPPSTVPEDFETKLRTRPEVTFAVYMSGRADYCVLVDCDGTDGLDSFLRWLKAEAGVASTESKIVLRKIELSNLFLV